MVRAFLSFCSPRVAIFIPSIAIYPPPLISAALSIIRNNESVKEDLFSPEIEPSISKAGML